MFQEEYNTIIQNPASIMDISLADIKGIAERYPYCQTAHVIYAKKLRELNSPLFDQQVKRAAVAVYDRNALYQYLEQVVTQQEPAMAGYGHENEHQAEPVFENEFIETMVEQDEMVMPFETLVPNSESPIDISIAEKNEFAPIAIVFAPEPPEIVDENPVLAAEIEAIPELSSEVQPEVIIVTPMVGDLIKDEEVMLVEEEVVLDEIIDNEQVMNSNLPEKAIDNSVHADIINEIPELNEEVQPEMLDIEQAAATDEALLLEEVSPIADEILLDELLAETKVEADWQQDEASFDDDEPLFDLPAYDIERELGTLAEADKYELFIRKQAVPEKAEEEFVDSFVGWLERLGSPSKGKLVEMKAGNKPVKKYLQASPVAGKSNESAQQEKVIDEIIAGELARKSLQMNDQLVTETYARILVMQGKYQKAVEMYMKLSLLKPQKSDYFAALIDQLKKRIK